MRSRLRLHHRGRRLGRLRDGEPALGALRHNRVLLLEAGRDAPPGQEPADILDIYPSSYYNKAYMWPGLKVHWRNRHNSAADRLRPGAHHRRRLVRDGHGRAARHPRRLRRVGAARCARLGLGRTCCPISASSKTISISAANCTAATDRRRSAACRTNTGHRCARRTPVRRAAPDAARRRHERRLPRRLLRAADEQHGAKRASAAICYLDAAVRRRGRT